MRQSNPARTSPARTSRREFLRTGLAATLALPAAPALLAAALSGCGSAEQGQPGKPAEPPAPPAKPPVPAPEPSPPAQPPAPPTTGGAAPPGEGELVTEMPAMATLVASLQYVHRTSIPEQRCQGCQFYTAGQGDRGRCQLFTQGLVAAQGWCASWTKKISAG